MVEAARIVRLAAAGAEDERSGRPADGVRARQDAPSVMGIGRSLEPVKHDEQRVPVTAMQPVNEEHIIVGRRPPFDLQWHTRAAPDELPPECPKVTSRHEPGWSIGWDRRHSGIITPDARPFDMRAVSVELSFSHHLFCIAWGATDRPPLLVACAGGFTRAPFRLPL